MSTLPPMTENCWFCSHRPSSFESAVEVTLRKGTGYTKDQVTGTTVLHGVEKDIVLPRCSACKQAHTRPTRYATVGCLASGVYGVSILVLEGLRGEWKSGLIGMGSGLVGWTLIAAFIGWLRITAGGYKRPSYAKEHPRVRDLLQQGWTVKEVKAD